MLIETRNELEKKEQRTQKEKIEILLLRKKVRAEIKKDVGTNEVETTKETLTETNSMKKVKKRLYSNKMLIPSMEDECSQKVYDRKGITEVATRFYQELYKARHTDPESPMEMDGEEDDDFPEILQEEVKRSSL